MRVVIFLLAFAHARGIIAAAAEWSVMLASQNWYASKETMEYVFGGVIQGEGGGRAEVFSHIYGHMENGRLRLKHKDFSLESLDPTFNWWALALCGDVIGEATFGALTAIEDFVGDDFYVGGTAVDNPSDFYMAFKVSEVLLEGNGYVSGQTWYGWAHVSIDENLNMTLLGEGINLDGGAVTVGVVPEPSAALLLLAGGALLALRRRERQRRWGGSCNLRPTRQRQRRRPDERHRDATLPGAGPFR